MRKTAKLELLKTYRQKEPQLFIQLDGFADIPSWNAVRPDKDGHMLMGQTTYELMNGAEVRVLIRPEVPKQTVLALLNKIAAWVAREEWPSDIYADQDDF